jgi:hypothetical protein
MNRLEDYEPIVGAGTVDELRLLGRRLAGKHIVTVNSTAIGGGVAEILNRMVPLCNQLGVDLRWEVMKGGEDFFAVTKRIHNALHGKAETFTAADRDVFRATTEANLATLNLDADLVFITTPNQRAGGGVVAPSGRVDLALSHRRLGTAIRRLELPGRVRAELRRGGLLGAGVHSGPDDAAGDDRAVDRPIERQEPRAAGGGDR